MELKEKLTSIRAECGGKWILCLALYKIPSYTSIKWKNDVIVTSWHLEYEEKKVIWLIKVTLTDAEFSSVQSLSHVRLFATPWTSAHQASLSITNSWSSPKPLSIESVMPSNHLILCHPLLLLPPIPPSIRVFSNESTLHMRWPKYWSFSFSIIPS